MKIKYYLLVWTFVLTGINSIGQTLVLDSLFGENGSTMLSNQSDYFDSKKIIETPDNKLLFGGYATFFWIGVNSYNYLYKLDRCGILDSTFGVNGSGISCIFSLEDFKLQNDDKIVMCGSGVPPLARLNSDGNLDTSFNINTFNFYNNIDYNYTLTFNSIEIQAENKILCSGHRFVELTNSYRPFLIRYHQNGLVDSTFGLNGIIEKPSIWDFASQINYGVKLYSQPNGNIILFCANADSTKAFALTSQGEIDSTFGLNGVFTDYESNIEIPFKNNIALENGIIYVNMNSGDSIIVKKLLPDGNLDENFGVNGTFILEPDLSDLFEPNGIELQANNKILLYTSNGFTNKLIRLNSNGSVDTSYGLNGYLNIPFNESRIKIKNSFTTDDNKIIISGLPISEYESTWNTQNGLRIAKFTTESHVPHITYLNDTLYSNVESPLLAYQWYLNDIEIENAVNSTYQPSTPGNYSVTLTDTIECGQYTANFELETVGLHSIKDKTLLVFPNPATDFIVVNGISENSTFTITDIAGRVIIEGLTNGENSIIDISRISTGLYFFITDNGNVTRFYVRK
jgi:uncharacterized delta-60 repeat protein